MDLTSKVVLITGGSSGLGEQIAYEAAKKGAIVVICARRIQLLGQVREKCEALSGHTCYDYQLNIADPDSVTHVLDRVEKDVGTVDILVNSAGFGYFQEFTSFDLSLAERMFRVNVLGMMYMTQRVALSMAENGSGQIINVASMAGKMATAKSSIYSATKFAVLGFSNALRLELKPLGITVTTVNPGPIATPFFENAGGTGDYLTSIDWIVLKPEKLAQKIVASFGTSKREINAPLMMEAAHRLYTLFPQLGDYLAVNLFDKK